MKTRLALSLPLIALAALSAGACGTTLGTTISDTEQVSADGVNLLVVDNDNGEVIVRASQTDDNVISVNYQLRNSGDIEFSVTREGDTVVVRAEDKSSVIESAVANLTIRLPAQIAVNVATGNGRVEVEQMQSPINASTGNGSVTLKETEAGTTAALSTGNGRIVVEGHTGPITASTGNGSVSVSGHDGRITANSGNGRIDYSGRPEEGSESRLTTGNGDIAITLTGDVNVSFDIETDDGRVTVEAELASLVQTSERKVTGLVGALGSAGELTVRSGLGDISLTQRPD